MNVKKGGQAMRISKHAYSRISRRGLDKTILTLMEEILTPKYLNKSNHLFLDRKTSLEISRILRRTAEKIEKHSGTRMVMDKESSVLITAYRL